AAGEASSRWRLRKSRPNDRPDVRCRARRPVAELTIEALAPTNDGSVGEQRAGVHPSECEMRDTRNPGYGDRNGAVGRGPVAELAVHVRAPALDLPIGHDRASMVVT